MSAQLIDGKVLSLKVRESVKEKVDALVAKGVTPGLAVILVGEDPASQIYVRNKELGCQAVGIRSVTIRLEDTVTQQELEAQIELLNHDNRIHGILVQLPLPKHLNEAAALMLINPDKDVDGFHIQNTGKLFSGMESVVACTPKGALEMIKSTGVAISGKEAVVVGRSNIVGKPMAMLLLQENATVTVCHSRTENLKQHTLRADILVAAVGRAHFITADMIKPGAVVIDVGINRIDGKVVGDVDFDAAKEVAGFITPVPGGVGRMTISMLLDNTADAARMIEEKR